MKCYTYIDDTQLKLFFLSLYQYLVKEVMIIETIIGGAVIAVVAREIGEVMAREIGEVMAEVGVAGTAVVGGEMEVEVDMEEMITGLYIIYSF